MHVLVILKQRFCVLFTFETAAVESFFVYSLYFIDKYINLNVASFKIIFFSEVNVSEIFFVL